MYAILSSTNGESHVGVKAFKKLNWLPLFEIFNHDWCSNAFKFFSASCPLYLHYICTHIYIRIYQYIYYIYIIYKIK